MACDADEPVVVVGFADVDHTPRSHVGEVGRMCDNRGATVDNPGGLAVEQKRALLSTVANAVISHADELGTLDAAIGDGDHGHNMERGFKAVLGQLDALAEMSLPNLLDMAAGLLLSNIGGAAGPLYATMLFAAAKTIPAEPRRADAIIALSAAVAAGQIRGKSHAGQKTMLDVFIPVQAVFSAGGDARAVKRAALAAAEATIPMRASRGRASFLGDRSIGHMDPGARSASLIIAAFCDELERCDG